MKNNKIAMDASFLNYKCLNIRTKNV